MGKINQGILDGVSGKVGNVIGASWKGIDYLRIKPTSIANPRTPAQVAQRTRFKGVTSLAKQLINSIVRPIWNKAAVKMTGYNYFVKQNMEAFSVDGVIEDYSKLHLSAGSIATPQQLSVEKTDGIESGLTISWVNDGYAKDDDIFMFAAIDEASGEIYTNTMGAGLRSGESADIVLPFDAGSKVHLYVFFSNKDKRAFSDSVYATIEL